MSPTVFLSCTTGEFGSVRPRLARMVERARLHVTHQEDLAHRGVRTLQALEEEVQASDVVLHILGSHAGAKAPAEQAATFLERHPAFADRFAEIAADGREGAITYTEWEAWFALYFGKRLCVYKVQPPSAASTGLPTEHEKRLGQHKHYPKIVEDLLGLLEEIVITLIKLGLLTEEQVETQSCHLPYDTLGELFIGREPFLDELRRRFEKARRQGRWPNQAIHGLGGVGKTRAAVEYARRHAANYAALLFVSGETPETLHRDLAALAGVLQLNLKEGLPDSERVRAVLAWLHGHPGWLLLVDNVDDRKARDAVMAALTHWSEGHVLITGRWSRWGNEVEALELHVLAEEDAARFLLESTEAARQRRENDDAEARALARDLGSLCLALEQASAYVRDRRIALAEYRRRWAENAKNVREWADRVVMRYHEEKAVSLSLATTWQTTFDQLSPAARGLLHLLAWLSSEPLPRELFETEAASEALRSVRGEEGADVEEALAELRRYSLASISTVPSGANTPDPGTSDFSPIPAAWYPGSISPLPH